MEGEPLPGDAIRLDLIAPNQVRITITCKGRDEAGILFSDLSEAAATGHLKLELQLKRLMDKQ